MERLGRYKHSSLLGLFISYEEMKGCEYGPWVYIHNPSFSLQLTNRSNKLVLHNTKLEILSRYKHSSLLGLFVSYEEMIWPWFFIGFVLEIVFSKFVVEDLQISETLFRFRQMTLTHKSINISYCLVVCSRGPFSSTLLVTLFTDCPTDLTKFSFVSKKDFIPTSAL